MSMISHCEISLPHLERYLSLLIPWLIQIDLNASNCIDTRMNDILEALFCTEHNMAALNINSNQFDIAEAQCQQSLAYSRR
jgi:hypothetical protein